MKQRPRIYYSESQRALMWDRWQQGDSMHAIALGCDQRPREWIQPDVLIWNGSQGRTDSRSESG